MREIYYFYPKTQPGSFQFIAKHHIEQLKNYCIVQDLDLYILEVMNYVSKKNMLIHPVFYPILGDKPKPRSDWKKLLSKIRGTANHLGGFDTADSNKMSKMAVKVVNKFDLLIVPSKFALKAYKHSGVTTSIVILPHGIPKEFQVEAKHIKSEKIKPLLEFKNKQKAIYVLFFLLHSGYRKGADLLAQVIKPLLEEYENLYLIVKRLYGLDPYLGELRSKKTIEVSGLLTWDELRQLYDVCDIIVVPSRGGGFELNALEGISRGLPTLVPDAGCFKDYIKYTTPVKTNKLTKVFQNNLIHVGYGSQIDTKDFQTKLQKTIDNIEKEKRRFQHYAKRIREQYSWVNIGIKLHQTLIKYDFYK